MSARTPARRFRLAAASLAAAAALALSPAAALAQPLAPEPGASTYWWIENPSTAAGNFSATPVGSLLVISSTPFLPFIPFLDPSGRLFETMYGSGDIPFLADLSPL